MASEETPRLPVAIQIPSSGEIKEETQPKAREELRNGSREITSTRQTNGHVRESVRASGEGTPTKGKSALMISG